MKWILIILVFMLSLNVAWSQGSGNAKPFHYYNKADTVYTAPQCICEIPEDKDIKAPPQAEKDTSQIYMGQTPAFQEDPQGFDVIVVDTLHTAPPCTCPRIPNDFEAELPQSNHTIGGIVIIPLSYTYIHNRNRTFSIGYGGRSTEEMTSQLVRVQVTQMDKPFYEDPAYYGLRIGWSTNEGELEIEDEEREMTKVGVSTQHLVLGGVYGWWWQWESGFQMLFQFGLGYPVISEVSFTNPNEIRQDKFEEGIEFERQGYNFVSYFQGTGLSLGWTF